MIVLLLFALCTTLCCTAAQTKAPLDIQIADTRLQHAAVGSIHDTDGDGCWDIIRGNSASGASFTHLLIDGQCTNGTVTEDIQALLVEGALDSESYEIVMRSTRTFSSVATLIKDADKAFAILVPGRTSPDNPAGSIQQPSVVGIQMSITGDEALIAVTDGVNAAVSITQADGSTSLELFEGELRKGTNSISVPTSVRAGAYVLSVVTDRGTESINFTLQR